MQMPGRCHRQLGVLQGWSETQESAFSSALAPCPGRGDSCGFTRPEERATPRVPRLHHLFVPEAAPRPGFAAAASFPWFPTRIGKKLPLPTPPDTRPLRQPPVGWGSRRGPLGRYSGCAASPRKPRVRSMPSHLSAAPSPRNAGSRPPGPSGILISLLQQFDILSRSSMPFPVFKNSTAKACGPCTSILCEIRRWRPGVQFFQTGALTWMRFLRGNLLKDG